VCRNSWAESMGQLTSSTMEPTLLSSCPDPPALRSDDRLCWEVERRTACPLSLGGSPEAAAKGPPRLEAAPKGPPAPKPVLTVGCRGLPFLLF